MGAGERASPLLEDGRCDGLTTFWPGPAAGATCGSTSRWKTSAQQEERFTAFLHHLNVDTLRTAFFALKRKAAPGVDGVTWQDYEADLEPNLEDLHREIHRGAYRPQPSRRTYIPKADGRQRPLAVAALGDKIVQGACVIVLNAIYEEDFLGFSYGFRLSVVRVFETTGWVN